MITGMTKLGMNAYMKRKVICFSSIILKHYFSHDFYITNVRSSLVNSLILTRRLDKPITTQNTRCPGTLMPSGIREYVRKALINCCLWHLRASQSKKKRIYENGGGGTSQSGSCNGGGRGGGFAKRTLYFRRDM